MSDPHTVAVLGAGSWGSAFARVLGLSTSPESARASEIVMWSRRAEVAEAITERHENPEYLPGITLPTCVRAVTDAAEAVRGAGVVVVAVPAQHVRETLHAVRADLAPDAVVVSLVKGLERGTDARMSQVCAEELGLSPDRFAVVSGPNLALEIARGEPTATVVASASRATAERIAALTAGRTFRPYTNTDVVGVEIGGVVKNVIALAVGGTLAGPLPAPILRRFGARRVMLAGSVAIALLTTAAGLVLDIAGAGAGAGHGAGTAAGWLLWVFAALVLASGVLDAVVDTAQNAQGLQV